MLVTGLVAPAGIVNGTVSLSGKVTDLLIPNSGSDLVQFTRGGDPGELVSLAVMVQLTTSPIFDRVLSTVLVATQDGVKRSTEAVAV